MPFLNDIVSFGDIAAEDDSVLFDYFLSTDAVSQIESGNYILVVGRKGSGKTALVRHFTETGKVSHGKPLSLRSYPWSAHEELIDKGASATEAYVASWRLLIAIRLACMVCHLGRHGHTDARAALSKFLMDNFGSLDPDAGTIISQGRLNVSGLTISPQIAGISLGSITFGDQNRSKVLGLELNSLTASILRDVTTVIAELGVKNLFLHFDELDQGLEKLDESRSKMLTGLILAAREISRAKDLNANISPIVYLRSDIWEQLDFSDKNKITQSSSINLSWDEGSLLQLAELRIKRHMGENFSWSSIDDGLKMRGSQSKWGHIVSRTLLRPRDVIQFLNESLKLAKKRDQAVDFFINEDINGAREVYSNYLKNELDDEIIPHWKQWSEALQACSRTQTITFLKDDFVNNYKKTKSIGNTLDAERSLELLYRFSVIGYEKRFSKGGSSWSFKYTDNSSGWDSSAPRFKVHLGLKEYAKLKEERAQL